MKKKLVLLSFLILNIVSYGEVNSKVNIKTNIKKSAVESLVEKDIPSSFTGDENISLGSKSGGNLLTLGLSFLGSRGSKYSSNVKLNYTVNRGEITFSLNNWNLSGGTSFNGVVVGNLEGSSQKFTTDFKGSLGVNSAISLSENWELSSKTSPNLNLEKVILPVNVTISGFKINENISLREEVARKITPLLVKAGNDIDNKVKEVNLKGLVENYWKTLKEPILLDSESDIWLLVRAKNAYHGPLSSNSENISLTSGVEGDITVFLGKPETVPNLGTLPRLKSTSQDISKFHLNVPGIITYEKLEEFINRSFSNKIFDIFKGVKFESKKTVLEGDNKFLKVKNDFTLKIFSILSLDGTLIAKGTPEIQEHKVLKVKDFSFELETKSFILKIADRFFHNKIQEIVEENYLTLDFQKDLTGAKKLLQEKVTQLKLKENIVLGTNIEEFRITDIEIKEKEIVVYTYISGDSTLNIASLD